MTHINKNGNRYLIRVTKNGQTIHSSYTSKLGRFSRFVQAEQFSDPNSEVYIRLTGERFADQFGNTTNLINDGTYSNRPDLMRAYKAFLEEER